MIISTGSYVSPTAAEAGKSHCPLCHLNIKSGEDGWKEHLMGKDGCKQNPRRLPFLNKGKLAEYNLLCK